MAAALLLAFSSPLWDPAPRFVFTFTIGLTAGILILGPYAAAALYALRIGHIWGGNLRWPICILATLSTVFLLDYMLGWSQPQLWIATFTALVGTAIGHDATLATLELRSNPHLDLRMVAIFPLLIGHSGSRWLQQLRVSLRYVYIRRLCSALTLYELNPFKKSDQPL